MAFNRPFPNLFLCSRLSYVVSFSNYNMYLCETDTFSFRIKAENLSYVTTFELPKTGKNKFLPKFVNILEKLWKTEFSLNITNIVIFYFREYSNIRNI